MAEAGTFGLNLVYDIVPSPGKMFAEVREMMETYIIWKSHLLHWEMDTMTAIWQTVASCMTLFVLRLKFRWTLFFILIGNKS